MLDIDLRAAANVRLICRRFNDIGTPLLYRTVTLTKNLVSKEAETQHPQALLKISRYTAHLIIPSNLDPYWTRRILDRTENLRQIT